MVLEHKDLSMSIYYDSLSTHGSEKMGLMEYIIQKPQGIYLEIGAAGFSGSSDLLESLPDSPKLLLYFCDISETVLQTFLEKNIFLKPYIPAHNIFKRMEGLTIRTVKANLCNMPFGDGIVSGINMSSVMHEIYSYCGKGQIAKAFLECFRVLEPGGVLVYRDPEQVQDWRKDVVMSITTKPLKLFINCFLPKLLDSRFSSHVDDKGEFIKPNPYSKNVVSIKCVHKEIGVSTFSLSEFTSLPTKDIDFGGEFNVYCPLGLCNEIKRHYLLFVRNLFPEGHAGGTNIFEYLENGIPVNGYPAELIFAAQFLCDEIGVHPDDFCGLCEHEARFDAKFFSLRYEILVPHCRKIEFKSLIQTYFGRMVRESEEYYYYLNPDELITMVLKVTLDSQLSQRQQKYVLFPMGTDKTYHISRDAYKKKLSKEFTVIDHNGVYQDIPEGKRMVHFSKMPLEKAFIIASKLIKLHPKEYPLLRKYLSKKIVPIVYQQYTSFLQPS